MLDQLLRRARQRPKTARADRQPAIGPLPRWTTAYVLSADERAYKNMLANDDSAGSYSVHFRDENTGKPVSIADHPNLTDQFSAAEGGGLPDASDGNPNSADAAHQPSIAFVSYLESGDFVEGIRAAVVDKDRNPRWDPTDLASIDRATVARYLAGPAGLEPLWSEAGTTSAPGDLSRRGTRTARNRAPSGPA